MKCSRLRFASLKIHAVLKFRWIFLFVLQMTILNFIYFLLSRKRHMVGSSDNSMLHVDC